MSKTTAPTKSVKLRARTATGNTNSVDSHVGMRIRLRRDEGRKREALERLTRAYLRIADPRLRAKARQLVALLNDDDLEQAVAAAEAGFIKAAE